MSVKNKKVFVTGATGKIGTKLVAALIKAGYEVISLKRTWADILEIEKYKKEMRDCDYVYHLAAYQNIFDRKIDEFFRVNVEGTRVIMKALEGSKVKKFIYVSTVMVNQDNNNNYVKTKRQALELVKKSSLPWLVIYPGMVIDRQEKMVWWRKMLTGGIPGGLRLRFVDKKSKIKFIWIEELVNQMIGIIQKGRLHGEYILETETMVVGEYLRIMSGDKR